MRTIDTIIIHCSATQSGMDVSADTIRGWHRARGWKDIGYHYIIRLDGCIETGRGEHTEGAHTTGHNRTSIGVCYVGGLAEDGKIPEDTRTAAQKAALVRLLRELKTRYPNAVIRGHNEFAAKACPSFDVQQWLKTTQI